MHEVAHIDQRGVLELLLWEVGATLVVALIEFHQTFIDAQTAIIMEKAHHLLDSYSLVSGMGRYFIKKYVMNVDQQLTFEFELLAILEVLHEGFGNPKYAPCPLLVNMVTAGKKGVKSGEGFYSWTHGTKDLIVAPNFKK